MQNSKWRIYGSTAAYHWFPDWRVPKDLDILTPAKFRMEKSGLRLDIHWHDAFDKILELNKDPIFIDPDILFTLKVSHAEWDIKWDKTMYDIWQFQKRGCKLVPELLPVLKEVWVEVHGKKHVNLKQSVEEFFSNDYVNRVHEHEFIHECLAFNAVPMHTAIREDKESVWCSEGLFLALPFEQQLQTAMEEIMVIAIERRGLNSKSSKLQCRSAINYAHKLLITSMTTGWFARFLILNAHVILGRDNSAIMVEHILKNVSKLETLYE